MAATLLQYAEIWTMDDDTPYFERGDVLVKDGVIADVGPAGTITPPTGCRSINLSCLTLLPRLSNCHAHLSLTALRSTGNDKRLFPWLQEMGILIRGMSDGQFRDATRQGLQELLHSGVTCVCDCGPNGPDIVSEIGNDMGICTVSGLMLRSDWFGETIHTDIDQAMAFTKELIDRWSPSPGLATFFLGTHSPYTAPPELLTRVKAASRLMNPDFNLHLAENAEETKVIHDRYAKSPVMYADSLGLLDVFTIANHCVEVSDEDLTVLADRKVRIVHCPSSNAKLGSGIARVPEFLQHGISVALGTDSAASNDDLNMFLEMKMALMLQRVSRRDPAALGALQVLRMSTSEAATVLGLDNRIGSITAGKQADLVAVRLPQPLGSSKASRLEGIIYAPLNCHVLLVMIAGRVLLDDTPSAA